MLWVVGLKCYVRLHGVPGRQRKFFEAMDIFESAGLSFTRRGTNTGRIQSVFDKTSVRIRISYTHTWKENEHHGPLTPFWLSPPQRSLCVAPWLFYDYCYSIGVPSWNLYGGERHSCTEFIFSEKNTISPRRSYNFKWQYIYVVVNFYLG